MAFSRKGFLTPELLVVLILLVIFIFIIGALIKPLFSRDVHLGMKERMCQITIGIKNSLIGELEEAWYPLCSAERITLTKDVFEKAQLEDETLKEGGVRSILDLMRRCKFMVGGDQKGAIFSDKHCYICYVVETPNDDSIYPLTVDQFSEFALLKQTTKGDSYLRNLQSPGSADLFHDVALPEKVEKSNRYAIVYIDNIRPNDLVIAGKPLSGCVLGWSAGSGIPVVGAKVGLYACAAGALAGGATSIYDLFQENTNRLAFVPLESLKEREGSDELGCAGYEF